MTIAIPYKLGDVPVAGSRVAYRTANTTRFIVGEAETLGKVNRRGSDDVTSDHKTKKNFALPLDCVVAAVVRAHVKVEVSFETAW